MRNALSQLVFSDARSRAAAALAGGAPFPEQSALSRAAAGKLTRHSLHFSARTSKMYSNKLSANESPSKTFRAESKNFINKGVSPSN